MNKAQPTIMWDFENTLAYRPGRWRSALMDVLDEYEPGHNIDTEQIRLYLRDGFPWHQPNLSHHHLSTATSWWIHVESILARAYTGVGFDSFRAKTLARLAHEHFVNPQGFTVYDDTVPTLEELLRRGWKHVILSNHVPELPEIVDALGLTPFIGLCITSAAIGYEKPNSEAFRIALREAGHPEIVCMIGDNLEADVRGAESIGIPAILVRATESADVRYYAHNLQDTTAIVEALKETKRT